MHGWHSSGGGLSRMHANKIHVKHKLEREQRERDMHHNIAEASTEPGEQRRSWLVTRVILRLLGWR